MLNRKFVEIVTLSVTLFSILAFANVNGSQLFGDHIQQPLTDTSIQWLRFDSSLLKVNGLSESDTVNPPVITINKQVMQFARGYIAKNSYSLKKLKEQNLIYFTIMDSVFSREGIPVELKYLAIIESRLKTNSVSPVGAAGAWQLMPVAARMYSLKVSSRYDERKNFYKSTVAAAKLLKDLHNKFGDWLLVIAAYNSGPGGVYKAIKRSGSRNFWKLHDYLPAETRAHVKRFISTHYYYEEQGSVATLTKDEITGYKKAMMAFVDQQNKLLREKQTSNIPIIPGTEEKEEKIIAVAGIGEADRKKEK
jgi:membrane-bound lytic murein transglycosylase D